VNALKADIQHKHNEVIAFNTQLKENAIRQTQQDINQINNQVFSFQNKIENLHHLEATSSTRLEELEQQLQSNHDAIASTRVELEKFNTQLEELADKKCRWLNRIILLQSRNTILPIQLITTATCNLPSSKAKLFP
jgi:chromosome segregation protein